MRIATDGTATNGDRDAGGRFTPGNRAARGRRANIAERTAELRDAMSGAVTPDDLRAIVGALLTEAKGGNTRAAALLLDRLLGPSVAADIVGRIEHLEAALRGSDTEGTR
jgi:hypothetical protein